MFDFTAHTLLVRSRLHSGIYASDRAAVEATDQTYPATRLHVVLALDVAAYRRLFYAGSYGSIGAGYTEVALLAPDGRELGLLETDDYDHLYVREADDPGLGRRIPWSELPQGTVDQEFRDAVDKLIDRVWDGHNLVDFCPEALSYCPAFERALNDHLGLLETSDSIEVVAAPGWAILDCSEEFYDTGFDLPGAYAVEDLTRPLEAAGIDYELGFWSRNGLNTYVAVRTADLDRAEQAVRDALTPDD